MLRLHRLAPLPKLRIFSIKLLHVLIRRRFHRRLHTGAHQVVDFQLLLDLLEHRLFGCFGLGQLLLKRFRIGEVLLHLLQLLLRQHRSICQGGLACFLQSHLPVDHLIQNVHLQRVQLGSRNLVPREIKVQ